MSFGATIHAWDASRWRRWERLSACTQLRLQSGSRAFSPCPFRVHLAIGWSFLAAGLVAWEQRPDNRLGLLMTLSGIGCPAHVDRARHFASNVISYAGPWRTSGDWWARDPWNRDEWDIALHSGGLYRIFCDYQTGGWFIEGSYD